MPRSRRALVAAAVMAVALPAGSAAAPAVSLRSCGSIRIAGQSFRLAKQGRVTCADAAKLMRGFLTGRATAHGGPSQAETYYTLYGWRCGTGTGGGACKRHGGRDYVRAVR